MGKLPGAKVGVEQVGVFLQKGQKTSIPGEMQSFWILDIVLSLFNHRIAPAIAPKLAKYQ